MNNIIMHGLRIFHYLLQVDEEPQVDLEMLENKVQVDLQDSLVTEVKPERQGRQENRVHQANPEDKAHPDQLDHKDNPENVEVLVVLEALDNLVHQDQEVNLEKVAKEVPQDNLDQEEVPDLPDPPLTVANKCVS